MATFMQKASVLLTPAAAIGLAWFLAEDVSKAARQPHRTWRAVMHPVTLPGHGKGKRAEPGAPAPADGAAPAPAVPAPGAAPPPATGKAGPGKPAPAGPDTAPPPKDAPKPTAGKSPAPAPAPAPAAAAEVEFPVSGSMRLAPHGSASPLRDPTADREDLIVGPDGTLTLKGKWTAPETLRDILAESSRRERGVLYLVADQRAPWDRVREAAAAGMAAGFTRVALAVCSPDSPGKGRALPLRPCPATPPEEGTVIRVSEGGGGPAFDVGGEPFDGAGEEMRKRIRSIHEDYEAFSPGYAGSIDTTAWTVDGSGASTLGVVQALDALGASGVATARLAGLEKP